ncbi:MAG: hydrogenase maturation protease [Gallionellaceae bacterium]|nr:hydrogenase maturation protease [Gallionellaceae bacterium]
MTPPVLIFAIGNESRGDDALGPLLLRKLDMWLQEQGEIENSTLALPLNGGGDVFELLEEFQLQVENAMDMKGRRLVLFIDAGIETELPFSFYRAQAKDAPVLYSHALEPESLLKVYEQFYQEPPPAVFILCIRGEAFELGESLSPEATERLEQAFEFCKKRLLHAEVKLWEQLCSQKTVEDSMCNEDNPSVQA